MNRELKFKAWDHQHNKWATETDVSSCVGLTFGIHDFFIRDGNEINRFSFMQFTGRKDKNGIEIYESDILKEHGIVTWNDGELCWSVIDLNWNDRREWHNMDYLTSPFEIIGNIHENPNLLNQ